MLVFVFYGNSRPGTAPTTITVDVISEVSTGLTYTTTVSKNGNATTTKFVDESGLIRYISFLARTLPGYRIEVCGTMFPLRTYIFRSNIDLVADALKIWIDTRFMPSL
jgi:hypothetical protein